MQRGEGVPDASDDFSGKPRELFENSSSDVPTGDYGEFPILCPHNPERSSTTRKPWVVPIPITDLLLAVRREIAVPEDLAVELDDLHPLVAVRALGHEADLICPLAATARPA